MAEHVYLATIALFFGTVLLIFAMKYLAAMVAARARVADEAAYRTVAERALTAQRDSAAALAALRTELSRVADSVVAVERILRQVD